MIVVPNRLAMRRTRPDDLDLLDRIDAEADGADAIPDDMPADADAAESAHRRWNDRFGEQYVCFRLPQFDPIGYFSLYDIDHRHGTGWLVVMARAAHQHTGLAVFGAAVYLTHVFTETPLRRIHAQTSDGRLETFRSIIDDGTADLEVTFPGCRRRADGSWESLHWLSIDRDRWQSTWARVISPHMAELAEGRVRADAELATGTVRTRRNRPA